MPQSTDTSPANLKDIRLFQTLSMPELRAIQAVLKESSFRKGDIISTAGKCCDKVLIVKTGRVKVFRTSAAGREQILEVLQKGDTCACHPGASQWQCQSSQQALTDCTVYYLNRFEYVRLVNSNHKLAAQLNHIFAERLNRFSNLIENVSLDSSMSRVARFISDMTVSSSASKVKKEKEVSMNLTHDEIAQRLGMARETVTRHLNRLRRESVIDTCSHQIRVLDRKALERYLV